jgi:hypothetical protein
LQAAFPAGKDGAFAWLAGVFERLLAEHPERAELLRSGIGALDVTTQLRARGPVGGRERPARED